MLLMRGCIPGLSLRPEQSKGALMIWGEVQSHLKAQILEARIQGPDPTRRKYLVPSYVHASLCNVFEADMALCKPASQTKV